jgi:hypothetical protein
MRTLVFFCALAALSCDTLGVGSVLIEGDQTTPDEIEVSLMLGTDGLQLISAGPAAGLTLPHDTDGGLLRYELRDSRGATVASGVVFDPRHARAEHLVDGELTASQINTGRGALSIRVPPIAGDIVILEDPGFGWRELGSTRFDPEDAEALKGALLRQPEDVIGLPVRVVDHGAPAVKFDLLFLPEGYKESELQKFHDDLQRSIDKLSTLPDFAPYWSYFNIWRQDVRSRESGADDPTQGVQRDTAFDVSFNQSGVYRCTYPQSSAAFAAIVDLGKRASADFVVVLVNSDTYGGCAGGSFVLQTRTARAGDILAHELAHAMFNLADEYAEGSCSSTRGAVNVSSSARRDELPWTDLINTNRLPTPVENATETMVGAFEGAGYCAAGMYRPQLHCMMRQVGWPMCAVCKREMQRYFKSLEIKGGAACTGTSCASTACPESWREDGLCDPCLDDDPDCDSCPASWYGDDWCDACIRNDPDCPH